MPLLAAVVAAGMAFGLWAPSVALGAGTAAVGRWQPTGSVTTGSVIREFGGTKAITRPSRDATLGFSLPTSIREILVQGGATVVRGQPLVRGDDEEDVQILELQRMRAESDLPVRQARAAMELARVEHQNLADARSRGGSSPQELERARANMEVRELEYQNAQEQLRQESVGIKVRQARVDKFYLKAPFDGQVDLISVDVGQSVSEQEKIVRVVNVDTLRIDVPASMDDPLTTTLATGMRAWVLVEAGGGLRLMEGVVREVAPAADPASRTRLVRVELANPAGPGRLISGEACHVRFTPPPESVVQRLSAR